MYQTPGSGSEDHDADKKEFCVSVGCPQMSPELVGRGNHYFLTK